MRGAAVVVVAIVVVVTVVVVVVRAAVVVGNVVMTLLGLVVGGAEVGSLNWVREEEGKTCGEGETEIIKKKNGLRKNGNIQ